MNHLNNKTQYVDKDFQYICLVAKSTKIYLDLTFEKEDKFNDFEDYKLINDNKLDRNPIYLNDISRVRMVAEEQSEYGL